MGNFFEWFFVFISEILKGFASIFKGFWEGIKQIFNIKNYITIFKAHSSGFGVLVGLGVLVGFGVLVGAGVCVLVGSGVGVGVGVTFCFGVSLR